MDTHKEINKLLAGFVLGELSQQQQAEVKTHLAQCPQCSSELKRLEALIECTSRISESSADEQMCESAKDAILSAVETEEMETASGPSTGPAFIWRIIMKSRITKLAAAAVIIIAIVVGISYFGGSIDGTSVAWGTLAERIEQIETVSYRMYTIAKTKDGSTEQSESLISQSSQYGMQIDTFEANELVFQTYSLPKEKVHIVFLHQLKKYFRKELTEEQLQQFPKIEDPRKWLKSLLSEKYRELGRKVIDGVEVEGIVVEAPQFWDRAIADCRVQLWVDVENELPVQLVSESMPSEDKRHRKTVFDNFQWDVKFDPSVFEPPEVPSDYTEWEVPKQWKSRKKADN
ncbi:MAG: anti-sigma factor [Planctomycetota bacterium]|jgi:outer membrane lipoprotein-sorting protein